MFSCWPWVVFLDGGAGQLPLIPPRNKPREELRIKKRPPQNWLCTPDQWNLVVSSGMRFHLGPVPESNHGFNQSFGSTKSVSHRWFTSQAKLAKHKRFLTLGWSLGYQFASNHKGVFPTDTTPQKNYKNNTGVNYPSHIGKTRVYWLQPGYETLRTGIEVHTSQLWPEVHTYQVIYTYLIPVPIPSVYLPYYTKA